MFLDFFIQIIFDFMDICNSVEITTDILNTQNNL